MDELADLVWPVLAPAALAAPGDFKITYGWVLAISKTHNLPSKTVASLLAMVGTAVTAMVAGAVYIKEKGFDDGFNAACERIDEYLRTISSLMQCGRHREAAMELAELRAMLPARTLRGYGRR